MVNYSYINYINNCSEFFSYSFISNSSMRRRGWESLTPIIINDKWSTNKIWSVIKIPVSHPVSKYCYTSITPLLSYQYHTIATPLSHQYHTIVTSISYQYHTSVILSVTPLSHHLSHQYHTSTTPVLHHCHTSILYLSLAMNPSPSLVISTGSTDIA